LIAKFYGSLNKNLIKIAHLHILVYKINISLYKEKKRREEKFEEAKRANT